MQYVFTSEDIKKIDKIITERYNLSVEILMENVAANSKNALLKYFSEKNLLINNVAIFCGTGNNGGDGFALARHLLSNYRVTVFCVGNINKLTPASKANYNILSRLPNVTIIHLSELEHINTLELNYDCIIDAILGISGRENLQEDLSILLNKINKFKAVKIALDIPTGLAASTGDAHYNTFRADLTLSVLGYKVGMLRPENKQFVGDVEIIDIGAASVAEQEISRNFILEEKDILNYLPRRKPNSSKFDYGRVLVIAGSNNMSGAAALTANAAIKAGAGLVTLISTKIHAAVLPEIIAEEIKSTKAGTIHHNNYDYLISQINKADAVVVGPGLGDDKNTIDMLRKIIYSIKNKPVVVDADALRCINKRDILGANIILTPHCGEFARIMEVAREEIEANPRYYISQFYEQKQSACVLLKAVPTVISNGDFLYWNIAGNPGMATAGSGDVLSGIIGAVAARICKSKKITNNDFLLIAAIGARIHSASGDAYVQKNNSQDTLTASNLINYLKYVLY